MKKSRKKKARTRAKETTSSEDKRGSGLLVVNLRGLVNTRNPVRETLQQLNLLRRFNATIVPNNNVTLGMLESAKEHLAWCQLDKEMAEKLLSKRAETSNGDKAEDSVLKGSGFSSFEDLASALASGKTALKDEFGFRNYFRLAPPRGGFNRSIRRQYGEGGVLGPNRDLHKLVEKML
jgi:large subunit ribosomal protein L30